MTILGVKPGGCQARGPSSTARRELFDFSLELALIFISYNWHDRRGAKMSLIARASGRCIRAAMLSGLSILALAAAAARAQDAPAQTSDQKADKADKDKATTTVTVKGRNPASTID
ncbi:MAG TPA: hypothetical protein VF402_03765 [Asticcacaulis sp.]